MNFEVTIRPDEGYYVGGTFVFSFSISSIYPPEAPKVKCKTKVYHPNIDLTNIAMGYFALKLNFLAQFEIDIFKVFFELLFGFVVDVQFYFCLGDHKKLEMDNLLTILTPTVSTQL
nr:uncharacterized protein LOC104645363 [Solanum lycopersicum]